MDINEQHYYVFIFQFAQLFIICSVFFRVWYEFSLTNVAMIKHEWLSLFIGNLGVWHLQPNERTLWVSRKDSELENEDEFDLNFYFHF